MRAIAKQLEDTGQEREAAATRRKIRDIKQENKDYTPPSQSNPLTPTTAGDRILI